MNRDTGYKFPSACELSSDNQFTNPSNVYAEDENFTTIAITDKNQSYKNFNLNIPLDATILGIEIRVKAKASGGTNQLKANLYSHTSDDFIVLSMNLTTTNTWYSLGGSNYLGGLIWTAEDFLNTTTVSEIQSGGSSGNGVGIEFNLHSFTADTISVDAVQIRVYYSSNLNNNVLRVALPGYNAMTDTNPDHFSLYSDIYNILTKEKVRGKITTNYGDTTNIAHNLGYIPAFVVWTEENIHDQLILSWVSNSFSASYMWISEIDSTNLKISNLMDNGFSAFYFILYDNIT